MKPVDQTIFSEDGICDCFQACVASILEVDITVVPHLVKGRSNYFRAFADWLETRTGMSAVLVFVNDFEDGVVVSPPQGYFIATGLSPRESDTHHAVVMNGGRSGWKMVHDPHPSRDGILTTRSFCLFTAVM